MVAQVGYSVVGWRCVRSALCTWRREAWVSWLSLKTKVEGLSVVWPQNHWDGLTSKPVVTVFRFAPQNRQLWFSDLGFKITAMVYWFGPQNQLGFSLSFAPQNYWREDDAGHTSRYGGLLHLEASRAKVFQSGLNTGGGATAGGARCTIMKVASKSS
jgi:hypothetical protein